MTRADLLRLAAGASLYPLVKLAPAAAKPAPLRLASGGTVRGTGPAIVYAGETIIPCKHIIEVETIGDLFGREVRRELRRAVRSARRLQRPVF